MKNHKEISEHLMETADSCFYEIQGICLLEHFIPDEYEQILHDKFWLYVESLHESSESLKMHKRVSNKNERMD